MKREKITEKTERERKQGERKREEVSIRQTHSAKMARQVHNATSLTKFM
jgi:hypothetical protein